MSPSPRTNLPSLPTVLAAVLVFGSGLPPLLMLSSLRDMADTPGADVGGFFSAVGVIGEGVVFVILALVAALGIALLVRFPHTDLAAICWGISLALVGAPIAHMQVPGGHPGQLLRGTGAFETIVGIATVALLVMPPVRRDFPLSLARLGLPAGMQPWWKGLSGLQWLGTIVAFAFAAVASLADHDNLLMMSAAFLIAVMVQASKEAGRHSGPSVGVVDDVVRGDADNHAAS